jgi:hypothetical protein
MPQKKQEKSHPVSCFNTREAPAKWIIRSNETSGGRRFITNVKFKTLEEWKRMRILNGFEFHLRHRNVETENDNTLGIYSRFLFINWPLTSSLYQFPNKLQSISSSFTLCKLRCNVGDDVSQLEFHHRTSVRYQCKTKWFYMKNQISIKHEIFN